MFLTTTDLDARSKVIAYYALTADLFQTEIGLIVSSLEKPRKKGESLRHLHFVALESDIVV